LKEKDKDRVTLLVVAKQNGHLNYIKKKLLIIKINILQCKYWRIKYFSYKILIYNK